VIATLPLRSPAARKAAAERHRVVPRDRTGEGHRMGTTGRGRNSHAAPVRHAHVVGGRFAVPAQRRSSGATRAARTRAQTAVTWELSSFGAAAGAIAACFVLALLYLSHVTSVAAGGYEVQRLAAERDELRRQNALAELTVARLESPARIEAAAERLGLIRVAVIPVLDLETVAAER
jgi:hypothetical protein